VAEDMLRRADLRPGRVDRRAAPNSAPDTVIAQSVRPGTRLLAGTTVDLSIAASDAVRVPNFSGQSVTSARQLARRYGLNIRVAGSRIAGGRIAPGNVIDQKPRAGVQVHRGTTVDLWTQGTLQ
jgi:beta-lactam-binding protein with PASTA domain